jgi:hypothetical protein
MYSSDMCSLEGYTSVGIWSRLFGHAFVLVLGLIWLLLDQIKPIERLVPVD